MTVAIAHPTGKANFTEVTIGTLTIWYSYRTPIGFQIEGQRRVVRANEWGPTTARHLNYLDGGNKTARLDGPAFEVALVDAVPTLLSTAEQLEGSLALVGV